MLVVDDDITRTGSFKIRSFDKSFSDHVIRSFQSIPSDSCRSSQIYDVTLIVSYFRCRWRLARLVPLMRRQRGRKLLGVRLYSRRVTFYSVKVVPHYEE